MSLRTLGFLGIAEAISFIILLLAMVLKYGFDEPVGVEIMGPLHGLLFLAFVGLALVIGGQRRWNWQRIAIVVLSAVVPVAGYVVGHRLLREAEAEAA